MWDRIQQFIIQIKVFFSNSFASFYYPSIRHDFDHHLLSSIAKMVLGLDKLLDTAPIADQWIEKWTIAENEDLFNLLYSKMTAADGA